MRLARPEGDITLSSGARIENARLTTEGLQFQLRSFAGEVSHCLVTGINPKTVRCNNQDLPRSDQPVRRAPGWWQDEARNWLFLAVPHETEAVSVTVTGS